MEQTVTISPQIQRLKQRFGIIGNSPSLTSALERALQVAPIDLSVLIIGESGTGKEFFPNIIHENSARKHKKYIAVNCGAIPEGTIDSELFGHEKGAFTGAISSRKGYFEEANGGTIFLDEVAELPLTTQARLLRVLESGEYMRVGSSEVMKTDIRIVAATNKDMLAAIKEGKFREDLFYRLSTVQINIPPLRERGNDVLLLVRKFTTDFADRYRTPAVTLADSARQALLNYRWPGNVRQLKNIIEQIALFEAGNIIERDTVVKYLPDMGDGYKPAVIDKAQFDYTQERELLFKMLFQLQKELEQLKEEVASGVSGSSTHRELHLDVDDTGAVTTHHATPALDEGTVHDLQATDFELVDELIDTQHRHHHDEQKLNLEDIERETIKRALEHNGGRRKATAHELGISERTLYRKIKEYNLDDVEH